MPNDERPVDEMRFRRESVGSDGVASVFQHNLPNVLTHLYVPRGIDKEIPLYRGSFEVVDDEDGSSRRCDGDVRLCWRPTPKLLAGGTTAATVADLQALLAVPEGSGRNGLAWSCHQERRFHGLLMTCSMFRRGRSVLP